jgi:hypothetical protein
VCTDDRCRRLPTFASRRANCTAGRSTESRRDGIRPRRPAASMEDRKQAATLLLDMYSYLEATTCSYRSTNLEKAMPVVHTLDVHLIDSSRFISCIGALTPSFHTPRQYTACSRGACKMYTLALTSETYKLLLLFFGVVFVMSTFLGFLANTFI